MEQEPKMTLLCKHPVGYGCEFCQRPAPAPASPAALTVPEKITVSMAPTSEYAIGWNDCVDAILAALMEWRIKVAGPAGHERFETFKGETLDSACDAARGQGFYVVEDEDGRPVEEMNSWRK